MDGEVVKRKMLEVILVPVVAGLVYWNTLDAEFAYDDNRAILDNRDLRSDTPFYELFLNDFWGTRLTSEGSHKSFRPLCVATFRLNYFLHGLHPAGYHAANILLHMINTGLFLHLVKTISNNPKLAVLAALSFAVHPIHTEAVAGVVGRADLGACLFFLLSLLAYIHYCQLRDQVPTIGDTISAGSPHFQPKLAPKQSLCATVKDRKLFPAKWVLLTATCIFATISCLFKETGITVLGLCIVFDLFVLHGIRIRSIPQLASLTHKLQLEGVACLLGWMGVVVGIRVAWMGNKPPQFAGSDNPAADSNSWPTRFLTFSYLPVSNFQMLLYPWTLSYDWSMEAIPLVTSILDRRNFLTAIFYGSLAVIIQHISGRKSGEMTDKALMSEMPSKRRLMLALALLIVPFLPASNVLFYVGFVLAERILYIPSMGFSWIIAEGLIKCVSQSKGSFSQRSIWALITWVFVVHSVRTYLRNNDWKTEEKLYYSGAGINPAKSWSNLGNIWSQRGKLREAELAYLAALKHRPNMADAHYNLGLLLQDQRRFNESIASYRNAINFRRNMAVAYLNLGIALQFLGKQREAERIYRICAQLDIAALKDGKIHQSAKITCLFNLGRLLADEQQFQAAIMLYQEAVNKMPSHYAPQSLYNMLGEAYFQLNQSDLAEYWYKRALQTKPDHVPAQLTYARFLYKQNQTNVAEQIFTTIFHSAPNDSAVYHFYGQFLMDTGRSKEGLRILLQAAQIYPADYQTLSNAAGALRQSGENIRAEQFYRRAAEADPFQVSAHINLGAILHLNGQLENAELAYRRALQLDPLNAIAQDNLYKLRNLKLRQQAKIS